MEQEVIPKWEGKFTSREHGGSDNGIYLLAEGLKSTSYRHTNNKELPMETRVYVALTHLAMHYVCRVRGDVVPTFETYVAARLCAYTSAADVDQVIPADVAIELIKTHGILDGLIKPGYSGYDKPSKKLCYDELRWYSSSEIDAVIECLKTQI